MKMPLIKIEKNVGRVYLMRKFVLYDVRNILIESMSIERIVQFTSNIMYTCVNIAYSRLIISFDN